MLYAESKMRCGGCGSKVGSSVLSRVLARLKENRERRASCTPRATGDGGRVVIGLDSPDDAALVRCALKAMFSVDWCSAEQALAACTAGPPLQGCCCFRRSTSSDPSAPTRFCLERYEVTSTTGIRAGGPCVYRRVPTVPLLRSQRTMPWATATRWADARSPLWLWQWSPLAPRRRWSKSFFR